MYLAQKCVRDTDYIIRLNTTNNTKENFFKVIYFAKTIIKLDLTKFYL